MITINRHPSMSTALSPGHKATNLIDKVCMVWLFLDVMLQFHLYVMCIYMVLCKHYGTQSDCYFIVIWKQA